MNVDVLNPFIDSPTYIPNEDIAPVIRAIRGSHSACKDNFRRYLRSHSRSLLQLFLQFLHIYINVLVLAREQPKGPIQSRFSTVCEITRALVHLSARWLLEVSHLARPSRPCRGRPSPFSPRAKFLFFASSTSYVAKCPVLTRTTATQIFGPAA